MAKEKQKTFEESFHQIEDIIKKIESGNIGLNELEKEIEKANELLNYCKKELENIEQKIIKKFGQEN